MLFTPPSIHEPTLNHTHTTPFFCPMQQQAALPSYYYACSLNWSPATYNHLYYMVSWPLVFAFLWLQLELQSILLINKTLFIAYFSRIAVIPDIAIRGMFLWNMEFLLGLWGKIVILQHLHLCNHKNDFIPPLLLLFVAVNHEHITCAVTMKVTEF